MKLYFIAFICNQDLNDFILMAKQSRKIFHTCIPGPYSQTASRLWNNATYLLKIFLAVSALLLIKPIQMRSWNNLIFAEPLEIKRQYGTNFSSLLLLFITSFDKDVKQRMENSSRKYKFCAVKTLRGENEHFGT